MKPLQERPMIPSEDIVKIFSNIEGKDLNFFCAGGQIKVNVNVMFANFFLSKNRHCVVQRNTTEEADRSKQRKLHEFDWKSVCGCGKKMILRGEKRKEGQAFDHVTFLLARLLIRLILGIFHL